MIIRVSVVLRRTVWGDIDTVLLRTPGFKPFTEKLDHCIIQFQGFDWLSGHGI